VSKKSRRQRRRERRQLQKMMSVDKRGVTWFVKRSYHMGEDRIYVGECAKSTYPREGDTVTIIDHANRRSIRKVMVVEMGHKAFTFNPIEGSIQE
jgi:hypothetical protein